MELNKNHITRDEIIFGNKKSEYRGGIARFEKLTFEQLQKLIEDGYADPEDQQNDAPTLGEIAQFLKENPKFTAHGYVVEIEREDYRVSIEGVECNMKLTKKELEAFTEMFHYADTFQINPAYAWFD